MSKKSLTGEHFVLSMGLLSCVCVSVEVLEVQWIHKGLDLMFVGINHLFTVANYIIPKYNIIIEQVQ